MVKERNHFASSNGISAVTNEPLEGLFDCFLYCPLHGLNNEVPRLQKTIVQHLVRLEDQAPRPNGTNLVKFKRSRVVNKREESELVIDRRCLPPRSILRAFIKLLGDNGLNQQERAIKAQ